MASWPADVRAIVDSVARGAGVDPRLAEAISTVEDPGHDPGVIGDSGHSVGLFQLNDAGEGYGLSVQQRSDPTRNATIALTHVAEYAAAHPGLDPGVLAAAAQRPNDRAGYAAKVNAALAAAPASSSGSVGSGAGNPGGDAPGIGSRTLSALGSGFGAFGHDVSALVHRSLVALAVAAIFLMVLMAPRAGEPA